MQNSAIELYEPAYIKVGTGMEDGGGEPALYYHVLLFPVKLVKLKVRAEKSLLSSCHLFSKQISLLFSIEFTSINFFSTTLILH